MCLHVDFRAEVEPAVRRVCGRRLLRERKLQRDRPGLQRRLRRPGLPGLHPLPGRREVRLLPAHVPAPGGRLHRVAGPAAREAGHLSESGLFKAGARMTVQTIFDTSAHHLSQQTAETTKNEF